VVHATSACGTGSRNHVYDRLYTCAGQEINKLHCHILNRDRLFVVLFCDVCKRTFSSGRKFWKRDIFITQLAYLYLIYGNVIYLFPGNLPIVYILSVFAPIMLHQNWNYYYCHWVWGDVFTLNIKNINTVKSLLFVGYQFSWFSWVGWSTNLHFIFNFCFSQLKKE
jgi:hypothetical protein